MVRWEGVVAVSQLRTYWRRLSTRRRLLLVPLLAIIGVVGYTAFTASNTVPPSSADALTLAKPLAPTVTGVVQVGADFSVTFTQPAGSVPQILTYEYSTDGGSTWCTRTDGSTASPLLISYQSLAGCATTPVANTNYNIALRSVNSYAESPASNVVVASLRLGFQSQWRTNNAGVSTSSQVKLPLTSGGSYDFTVLWGDGTRSRITTFNAPEATHTYAASGNYTINIYGTITSGINFSDAGDRLKLLNISSWGPVTYTATSANYAFKGAANLTISATDAPNLATATQLNSLFAGTTNLGAADLSHWDVSNITSMNLVFQNSGFNGNISTWNVSKVTSMSGMFDGATSFNQSLNTWDVSKATNLSNLFKGATAFNGDIGTWDLAAATSVTSMFEGATSFNRNISNWRFPKLTNMISMFSGATAFNQPLNDWEVGNLSSLSSVFNGATSFNQSLSSWNVAKVTNMTGMFQGASAFNSDISAWNTAAVTIMTRMFKDATSFNQPLNTWNTAKVMQLANTFDGATSFNQPLTNWNTSSVTVLSGVFQGASSFNQSLASWDVTKATGFASLLTNSGISAENYNSTLISWANQNVKTSMNFAAAPAQISTTAAAAARSYLRTYKSWNITDGCSSNSSASAPVLDSATATASQITATFTPGATGKCVYDYEYSTDAGDSWVARSDGGNATSPLVITAPSDGSSFVMGTEYQLQIRSIRINSYTPETSTDSNTLNISIPFDNAFTSTWATTPAPGAFVVGLQNPRLNAFKSLPNWREQLSRTAADVANGEVWAMVPASISLPLVPGGNYNFTAHWGDGTSSEITSHDDPDATHLYAAPGTYEVNIVGTITGWEFTDGFQAAKLSNISAWGPLAFTVPQGNGYFRDAGNLTITATDAPDFASTNSLAGMFAGAGSLTNPDFSNWDVSGIQNFSDMFNGARVFNGNIGNWNIGSATTLNSMFSTANSFNTDISSWNTSSVTDMTGVFAGATSFNQNIGTWNTSQVTATASMFAGASSFNQDLSGWNLNNVTDASNMFADVTLSTDTYNALLIDLSSNNNANVSFDGGHSLISTAAANTARADLLSNKSWNLTDGCTNAAVPTAPTITSVTATETSFVAHLSAPSTAICGFNYQYSTNNGASWRDRADGDGLQSPLTITTTSDGTPLVAGLSYQIEVRAVNPTGAGAASASTTAELLSPFVTHWDVSLNSGTGNNGNPFTGSGVNRLELPLVYDGTYNFTVDWGDDTSDTITSSNQPEATHNYATGGEKTVTIRGSIHGWGFRTDPDSQGSPDALKLVGVTSWGPLEVIDSNFGGLLSNAIHLTSLPSGHGPNLSAATTLSNAFMNLPELTTGDLADWDVRGITSIWQAFSYAHVPAGLETWNTESLTDMSHAFGNAQSYGSELGSWDVSGVTYSEWVFQNSPFNSDISSWDVSETISLRGWFYQTPFNQDISGWDVSKVNDYFQTFANNTVFNQPIGSWNVTAAQDLFGMFDGATAFDQDLGAWLLNNAQELATFMTGASLSPENYNSLLSGWAQPSLPGNKTFSAGSSQLSTVAGNTGRNYLRTTKNWNLTDGCTSTPAPSAPTITQIDGAAATLTVTFAPPTTSACIYNYQYSTDDGSTWRDRGDSGNATTPLVITTTSSDNTALVDGVTYQVQLRAINPTGTGTASAPVPGTPSSAFVTVWQVTDAQPDVALPLIPDIGVYNFVVDWGDGSTGTVTSWDDPDAAHTYASIGEMTVTLTGQIEGWGFTAFDGPPSNPEQLLEVASWGSLKIVDASGYYLFTNIMNSPMNLRAIPAGQGPDLSAATSLNYAFYFLPALQSGDLANWDVSGIRDLSNAFEAAHVPAGLETWDVSGVTNFSGAFSWAESWGSNVSAWNTAAATNMSNMFHPSTIFNQDISGWDVSKVTNMAGMFASNSAFNQNLSGWDVSKVTSFGSMFTNATSFNQDLGNWNPIALTNAGNMFNNSGLSSQNYSALLASWGGKALKNSVSLGATNKQVNTVAGATGRSQLLSKSWTVSDGCTSSSASAPTVTSATSASGNITVNFTHGTGNCIYNYEYSTDAGSSWTSRSDAGNATSPIVITQTSAGDALVNGQTYPVQIRPLYQASTNQLGTASAPTDVTVAGGAGAALVYPNGVMTPTPTDSPPVSPDVTPPADPGGTVAPAPAPAPAPVPAVSAAPAASDVRNSKTDLGTHEESMSSSPSASARWPPTEPATSSTLAAGCILPGSPTAGRQCRGRSKLVK